MHESLISDSESIRTEEIEKHYVISPSYNQPVNDDVFEYSSSQSCLSKDELKLYLDNLSILEKNAEDFTGKVIQEYKRD